MTPNPARETIRSTEWRVALVAILGTIGFVYAKLLAGAAKEWLKPDYSHGFLVPLFSVYLAWRWRAWAPERIRWPALQDRQDYRKVSVRPPPSSSEP